MRFSKCRGNLEKYEAAIPPAVFASVSEAISAGDETELFKIASGVNVTGKTRLSLLPPPRKDEKYARKDENLTGRAEGVFSEIAAVASLPREDGWWVSSHSNDNDTFTPSRRRISARSRTILSKTRKDISQYIYPRNNFPAH